MERPYAYHLIDGEIVPAPNDRTRLFQSNEERTIGRAIWYRGDAQILVSTMFLNIDHAFGPGPPVLFETMIFWPAHPLDEFQERYTTLADAKAGHATTVALVEAAVEAAELETEQTLDRVDAWLDDGRPAAIGPPREETSDEQHD